ncbi:MAG: hypothetical protein IJ668_10685 [Selenomonadaceae bacterium]|nr:hypothetical protein [Selenomonadaceae bacterium]
MEVYHAKVDASKLDGVIDLPEEFKNQQVKLIVIRDLMPKKPKDPERIEAAIQRLTGIIPKSSPYQNMTLDQIREERLSEKYGIKFAD